MVVVVAQLAQVMSPPFLDPDLELAWEWRSRGRADPFILWYRPHALHR